MTPRARPGCYAQAVMDLGATICTPKRPACGLCPWRESCRGRLAGTAPDLPAKTPKKPKPVRHGIAYLARRVDGAWLLERRPGSGLLGGMLGWPGSDWVEGAPEPAPPIRAEWHPVEAEVRHTFTHFHLRLALVSALVPMDRTPARGAFVQPAEFRPSDLPTVMRKAFDLVRER
jgi:A/G-specific adenine glycosylase